VKIFLFIILLLPDGNFIEGDRVDGYAPREQPDMATCQERVRRSAFFAPPAGYEQIFMWCEARRVER
jgi:hypothetical protein